MGQNPELSKRRKQAEHSIQFLAHDAVCRGLSFSCDHTFPLWIDNDFKVRAKMNPLLLNFFLILFPSTIRKMLVVIRFMECCTDNVLKTDIEINKCLLPLVGFWYEQREKADDQDDPRNFVRDNSFYNFFFAFLSFDVS